MNAELQLMLHQALTQLAVIGGPMLAALLVVGLLIGILQAATQINDPAVGFLPRLVTGLLVAYFSGHWVMERLSNYFAAALRSMAGN